jgi:hypothetical protein
LDRLEAMSLVLRAGFAVAEAGRLSAAARQQKLLSTREGAFALEHGRR